MRLQDKSMGYARIYKIVSSVLTVAAAFAALTQSAAAQTPPELPKSAPTERQSPVNPFPFAFGNAQNRGWAAADDYWGILDANIPAVPSQFNGSRTINGVGYRGSALSRVPNYSAQPRIMELDGWGFPRGASVFGAFLTRPAINVPQVGGVGQGQINDRTFSAAPNFDWTLTPGPSEGGSLGGGSYYRIPARPRPNLPAATTPGPPASPGYIDLATSVRRVLVYNMNQVLPGASGLVTNQAVRFQIRPNIPTPAFGENRVSDARFTVYYYNIFRSANGTITIYPKQKTFFASQTGAGEVSLLNSNGVPAFFPFYNQNTMSSGNLPVQPGLGVRFQGVIVDDTTTDAGDNLFVLADRINLVGSIDAVLSTPTVTRPHGGRRVITVAPGTQPLQPASGPNYVFDTINKKYLNTDGASHVYRNGGVDTGEWYNNLSTFINNPYDVATIDASDPDWTANPSILFRGPESLADPRLIPLPGNNLPPPYPLAKLAGNPVGPGTQGRPLVQILDPITKDPVGTLKRTASSIDSNNHDIYRADRLQAYTPNNLDVNPVVPYFSHQQVLMARTEYAPDPEDGVADAGKDGTLTIAVGAVFCLDGQTGAPIWRFPDHTYEPGRVRNPKVGSDPVTNRNVYQIPGIRGIDKNLDGTIQDDEVFIVGQGNSPSGGIFSSVTYAPKVPVRGAVKIPTYTRNAAGVTLLNFAGNAPLNDAPSGRYYKKITYDAVPIGMAYIAAANGVVYAVDAYGNNDNDYFPNTNTTTANLPKGYFRFGDYRPGTTNVLWFFAPTSRARKNTETLPDYFKRLKTEIPVPGSYGQSAPIIAYNKDEEDLTASPYDPDKDEPRLFVGNQNGYVYALDARADAGYLYDSTTGKNVNIGNLPFRKEQGQRIADVKGQQPPRQITGVRWWFGTRGGINATPAVSLMRQNAGKVTGETDLITKGVYVNSLEGRVYCIDWDGPVQRMKHTTPVSLNNIDWLDPSDPNYAGSAFATIAAQLNDDYKFHNILPANGNARADQEEGDIRPRWTYPNLYRIINPATTKIKFSDPADNALANGVLDPSDKRQIVGKRLIEPGTSIAAITTPPVLVDFPFQKNPSDSTTRELRSYLTFQAHDATNNGEPPTQSRVYLLDQVGDRANFLSNPVARAFGSAQRVSAYPRDRFSPKQVLGDSAPAWSYRNVYDTYDPATFALDMTKRNSPIVPPILLNTDTRLTANQYQGVPSRRLLPTLYMGGVGKVFAVDFDLTTGLFQRWRTDYNQTAALTPLPDLPNNFWGTSPINTIFQKEASRDLLSPLDPSLRTTFDQSGTLRDFAQNRVLARVLPLEGTPSSVNSVVISGGPLQNRSNRVPINNVAPGAPTVPLHPTNDAPNWNPLYFDLTDTRLSFTSAYLIADPLAFDFRDVLRGLGHFVNQDINDPLTTTEGVRSSDTANGITSATTRIPNIAYQFPTLFIGDAEGNLHSASSNIEGEDRSLVTVAPFRSYTIGWALYLVTDNIEDQIQPGHSLMFSQFGPGGPGGVAVVTNAYFPALDPSYNNKERVTANPTSPYRYYPNGEPNTTSPTPYKNAAGAPTLTEPVANNDDPRPDFRPRSLSPGVAGGVPVAADTNTGQPGFPLDLHGLFFDKRFAGKNGAVLPNKAYDTASANFQDSGLNDLVHDPVGYQNPNGSYKVKLRLPGYSYIGGLLTAADFGAANNPNNQIADGARRVPKASNTSDNIADGNDDINPAAQNVAWIYAGGLGGLLYAYTPAMSGQSSGGAAGTPNARGGDDRLFGVPTPKVAIVDADAFDQIQNLVKGGGDPNPTAPTNSLIRSGSIARKGGKNFYEWGETVYVVIYDLLGRTNPTTEDDFYVLGNGAVQIEFRNALQNSRSGGTQGFLYTNNGTVATYRADNSADPNATPLGIALVKFRLGDNSPQFPQTPGDTIQVSAVQNGVRQPGRVVNIVQSARTTLDSADGFFSIANPLAVQGFLAGTTGRTLGLSTTGAKDIQNGVGPFESVANQYGNVKSHVTYGQVAANTNDPDKYNFEYAAALTNGNRVRRRDLRRFIINGANVSLNPAFSGLLKDANGGDDPEYDFPVMVNTAYINHGDTGTTDIGTTGNGTTTQNLRIMNRSLLPTLKNVRVAASSSLLWRYWPGRIPNAEADVVSNPRYTPLGMDIGGRINPLPWETGVNEAKPWNPTAPGNSSPDYPDISTVNSVKVNSASGNLVVAPGNLNAGVNTDNKNQPIDNGTVNRAVDPRVPIAPIYATAAAVTVPKYQPANLVATHNLTSAYIAPSMDDAVSNTIAPITETNPAAVQLPRGVANRDLKSYSIAAGKFSDARDIAPYGYSTRMAVTVGSANTVGNASVVLSLQFQLRNSGIDPNNRGAFATTYGGAPYREFELSLGVPVDSRLEVAEQTVDLGSLGHSFGIENGLLGYGAAGDPAFASGLLPAPLFDTTLFPSPEQNAPYGTFFKKFTVQNTGNVNLWNIRAAQRIENPVNGSTAGTGFPFRYLGLLSETVDPKFGILAVGADPLSTIGNVMPQIVTSLDQRYDAAWDKYLQTGPAGFSQPYTVPLADGTTPYALYYAGFAGRHPLHKPIPSLNAATVASIPDLPSGQYLRPIDDPQPQGLNTVVGVAVPLGTPSGTYTSLAYGQRFVVFEDHDTLRAYNAVPTVPSGTFRINPAGPMYAGSNVTYPGTQKIQTRGSTTGGGEGIWRYRYRADGSFEPLPASNPGINLKVTVGESPLTGDIADRGLESGAAVPLNVAHGRLPGVDTVPVIDPNGTTLRPAASLTPAAYRGADGKIHLFYSRNYQQDPDPAKPFAQPGQPFKLFTATLNWNTPLGAFTANNIGAPLADARTNAGKWFSDSQLIGPKAGTPQEALASNVAPFILQPDPTLDGATLYWVNSQPRAGGGTYNQIYYSALNGQGQPTDPNGGQPFLLGYDAALQRYAPRALYAPYPNANNGRAIVFYYGGLTGKWSLFYSVRPGAVDGSPIGTPPDATKAGDAVREVPLTLPESISSATDPAPVYRGQLLIPNGATYRQAQIVDVYYSGVLKTTQTPDVYQSRFELIGTGDRIRLRPVPFPRITGETLKAASRGSLYQGANISWNRNLQSDASGNFDDLPIIYIGSTPVTLPNRISVVNRQNNQWQYDAATKVLYQSFQRGGKQGVVYVDAESGAVRFRGSGGPGNFESVFADYSPQVQRLTSGGSGSTGVFSMFDSRLLLSTINETPALKNGVIRRVSDGLNVGRNWLFYQRGSTALQYAARRVGIDLRSIPVALGGMAPGSDESIALRDRDLAGNMTPNVGPAYAGGGWNQNIRAEVYFDSGRIYVAPQFEGLPLRLTYFVYQASTGKTIQRDIRLPDPGKPNSVPIYLRQIDELTSSDGSAGPQQVPLLKAVNESQPYAFLDLLDRTGFVTRTDPGPAGDPTLQTGRVWLFWSSPRGRLGAQTNSATADLFPPGYDLYWQTLAPNFDPKSYSGLPPR